KDLSSMWSEETVPGMNVVLKEKEKSDKARDICAANWNKTVASSGWLKVWMCFIRRPQLYKLFRL
ncbi:hypothetical protein MKX03_032837, partial [Papaver bracteatum]